MPECQAKCSPENDCSAMEWSSGSNPVAAVWRGGMARSRERQERREIGAEREGRGERGWGEKRETSERKLGESW